MKTMLLTLPVFAMLAFPALANDPRDTVRAGADNDVVVNSFGNCVRTRWTEGSDDCARAQPVVQAAVQPQRVPIAKEERTVYFDFNKATLTQEGKAKLDTLAQKLRSDDQVREAQIVGYADRIGTTSYNEQLSKKRAEAILSYLTSKGVVNARVADTRWFGESNPASNCPELKRQDLIECLQPDRRVEVEIEYQPLQQANR